jgi:hypothetical protein
LSNLSDNGSAYIAKDTLDAATASAALLHPRSARRNPTESPRPSSKPSNATVLDCRSCPDAATVIALSPASPYQRQFNGISHQVVRDRFEYRVELRQN